LCHVLRLRPSQQIFGSPLCWVHRGCPTESRATQQRDYEIHKEPRTLGVGVSRAVCNAWRSDASGTVPEIGAGPGRAEAHSASQGTSWIESACGGNQKAGGSNPSGRATFLGLWFHFSAEFGCRPERMLDRVSRAR